MFLYTKIDWSKIKYICITLSSITFVLNHW